jgi:hypothetical protein
MTYERSAMKYKGSRHSNIINLVRFGELGLFLSEKQHSIIFG